MTNKLKMIIGKKSSKQILKQKLKQMLGITPKNIEVYLQALRHATVAESVPFTDVKNSNERLEFLGDAILGSVIADFVFTKYPFEQEGFLTKIRSRMVSRENLNYIARKMGIDQILLVDKRIFSTPNGLSQAYGNAMEAIIGAVYLDKGYERTRKFIIKTLVQKHMDLDKILNTEKNFKSRLIEWGQRNNKKVSWMEEEPLKSGRQLMRKTVVLVDGQKVGEGLDHVKKKSEQQAAERACLLLEIND